MNIVYCTRGRVSVRDFLHVWSFTSYIQGLQILLCMGP